MKALNLITLVLTIIAGINLGVIGLTHVNVIATVFASAPPFARAIEIALGLAALYQLYPLVKAWSVGEIHAEASHA